MEKKNKVPTDRKMVEARKAQTVLAACKMTRNKEIKKVFKLSINNVYMKTGR